MRTLSEVVITIGRVERHELVHWIELGWVAPSNTRDERSSAAEPLFSELDVARVRMICDLRRDMVVDEDTMPLVLSLLDQIYALRHQMNSLTGAVRRQPQDVQNAILAQIKEAVRERSR